MEIMLYGHMVELCVEKALYLKQEKTLVIADVHLGKANHFRKAGFGVPSQLIIQEIIHLQKLLDAYSQLETVVFLGDLFHSSYNGSVALFWQLLDDYPHLKFILVLGNHDIMNLNHYKNMEVVTAYCIGTLVCSHDAIAIEEGYCNIYGHIHPGVRLHGQGRQVLTLPCYYKGGDYLILPAFGLFTGLHLLSRKSVNDEVYVIAGKEVILQE